MIVKCFEPTSACDLELLVYEDLRVELDMSQQCKYVSQRSFSRTFFTGRDWVDSWRVNMHVDLTKIVYWISSTPLTLRGQKGFKRMKSHKSLNILLYLFFLFVLFLPGHPRDNRWQSYQSCSLDEDVPNFRLDLWGERRTTTVIS